MTTLKLRSTESSGGRAMPANPLAKVGDRDRDIIYQIVEIPDGISAAEVATKFNETCTISGFVFKFSELGMGRIVRGGAAR